jgi:hypothetical protein
MNASLYRWAWSICLAGAVLPVGAQTPAIFQGADLALGR